MIRLWIINEDMGSSWLPNIRMDVNMMIWVALLNMIMVVNEYK
jgi:hypothetical protein